MEKTFDGYINLACDVAFSNPDWRWGQTLFNVLSFYRPELAEKYRGTPLDPFYNDDRCADFLAHVEDAW